MILLSRITDHAKDAFNIKRPGVAAPERDSDYCSEEYSSTFKNYSIIFGAATQAERTFPLAVIFIP